MNDATRPSPIPYSSNAPARPLTETLRTLTEVSRVEASEVLASVLNTDILAMRLLDGRSNFSASDAARVSRVYAEYANMGAEKKS